MINTIPARPNVIEKKLVAALRRADRNYSKLGKKKSNWTRAIKKEIGDVGKKLGFEVYPSGYKSNRNCAWLFDLIWSKEKGDFTLKLPLVMESEWENKDILWDFTKLVVARAQHRVIVFQGHTLDKVNAIIDKFLEQVRRFEYSETGDRYLFCCWTNKPEKFMYKLYKTK